MWFSVLGFSSGGMDYGMVGGKEAGTESRFKQWTSMMEGLPSVATQEANMHKNGKSKRRVMSWGCSDPASMKCPIKYLKAWIFSFFLASVLIIFSQILMITYKMKIGVVIFQSIRN